MKRFTILFLLVLMTIPVAEAKRRETDEEIARKTRHYEGWEFGAAARFDMLFYEMDYMRIRGQKGVSAYQTQTKFGGNAMVNAGYFLNNHWKIGAELGAQIQYNDIVVPVYLTAHYYYGKRKNCLFNFVNLGTNVIFNHGPRFGATGAAGVGVRLQKPEGDHAFDIMVGYQAIMLNTRPAMKGDFSYDIGDINRKTLNQGVFIGLGMTF